MRTLITMAGVLAVVWAMTAPAQAQWVNPAASWNYEAQSHGRWKAEREALYGPDGPTRNAVHQARCTAEKVVHEVKQAFGNPDFQYYSRWDRRRLGAFGPYPSTAANGLGFGQSGAIIPSTPVYGGQQLNRTGGARTPTRWNPSSRTFW